MKKPTNVFLLLTIIILSLIPLRSLLQPGMFNSHDGEIHIARLANFYESLTQGNIFPRWGGNLNHGLGHPTLMFLYPLPNYFGSLIHFMGFSFVNTVKILFASSYVLSGIFMYLLLIVWFGAFPAAIGSLIYLFTPYRFVDFFVRGALPEHMFFMFAPLALLTTTIYINKPSYLRLICSSIVLSLCILTHNASAFFFYPFALILFLVKNWSDNPNKIKIFTKIFLPFLFGIIISFFYWFPALVEGKYTLRYLIINKQSVVFQLTNLWQLVIPNWGFGDPQFAHGLSVQIGIINLVVFALLIYFLIRKKLKLNLLILFLIICYLFAIFLMIKLSKPVWLILPIIYNILYPWRLLVLLSIISPIFGAIIIQKIFKNKYKFYVLFIFLFGIISLLLTYSYQKPSGFFLKSDAYFLKEYVGTADLGESSPIWSTLTTDNKSYPTIAILSGNANIKLIDKLYEYHKYQIDVKTDKARIIDYTLYFPGWDLFDNQQKITNQIEFQDPEFRGLMTFWLPQGKHQIVLKFNNTRVRNYAAIISLLGISLLIVVFLVNKFYFKKPNLLKSS